MGINIITLEYCGVLYQMRVAYAKSDTMKQ